MKILVVVDMQNDFIDGSLGTPEAQAIVPRVVEKIKRYKKDDRSQFYVTLDTHPYDYLETSEGKKLPVEHCIRMTQGWLLNKEILDTLKGTEVSIIEKPTFGSVKLVEDIRKLLVMKNGTEQSTHIELIGLCTDICVISNALLLKANFPDAKITADASCCAGVTPEKHKAALEVMKSCQIEVVNE